MTILKYIPFFAFILFLLSLSGCSCGDPFQAECSDDDDDSTTTTTSSVLCSTSSSSTSSSVSTPFTFETILTQSICSTPTIKTSVTDKGRVLIKYSDSYMATNSSYGIELNSSLSTFEDLMLKTFYLVEESSASCYRLDSEKHSNYSIDYDSSTNKLLMRNDWGYDRSSSSAYLCFTFDTTNNTMTASKRSFSTINVPKKNKVNTSSMNFI